MGRKSQERAIGEGVWAVTQFPATEGLALLARLEDVLNTPLETGDLPESAATWEAQVNDLIADDPDIATYIAALEERRDEETPTPSGDSIAAEFERYLKRRNRP